MKVRKLNDGTYEVRIKIRKSELNRWIKLADRYNGLITKIGEDWFTAGACNLKVTFDTKQDLMKFMLEANG